MIFLQKYHVNITMGFRKTHKSNRYRHRHKKTRKNKMKAGEPSGEMRIPAGEMRIPPGEMQIPLEEQEDTINCEVVQNYKLNKYKNKSNTVKEEIIKIGDIDTKIIYVIPKNVMIESVDTLQKPVFNIFVNNTNMSSKMKIEKRYINCFVYLCGEWYAMMRVFNERIFRSAYYTNYTEKIFYKLNNIYVDIDINNPENGTGKIIIPDNIYTHKKGLFSSGKLVLVPESYTVITEKHSIFMPLYQFRNLKVLGNVGKYIAINAALRIGLDMMR
jgi:hypothetical protein